MFETYQRPLRQPCQEVTSALQICYRAHGKNGEDCVREELSHKKCFAQMLCHREAYRFYDERKVPLSGAGWGGGGGGRAACATLVEVFAKPENELEIPEGVGKEDRVHCRNITMELAACLAKKRK